MKLNLHTLSNNLLLTILFVFFLLFGIAQISSATVCITWSSDSNYAVLLPDLEYVTQDSNSKTVDIYVENNTGAWYYVSVSAVAIDWSRSNLPNRFCLRPHEERHYVGRARFLDHGFVSLVADGTFNHKELALPIAGDIIWRCCTGSALPDNVTDALLECFYSEIGLMGNVISLATCFETIPPDFFGIIQNTIEICKNDKVRTILKNHGLSVPSAATLSSILFYSKVAWAARLEIETLLARHYDALWFEADAIGGGGSEPPSGTDAASFRSDVTIPDNTKVSPNQSFTKTWKIANTGTRSWGNGYKWTFDGGAQLDGPNYISVPSVSPGSTWNPSVTLMAPSAPGTYRGYWQMQAPDGQKFGDRCWVQIQVPASDSGGDVGMTVSESARAAYDGAPGFWKHGTAAYWHDEWNTGDGGHVLWTYNNDPSHGINNMGDWRPRLPSDGWYDVSVYIPTNKATAKRARYEIYHAVGRTDIIINQSITFGEWVPLGTYQFKAGTGGFLRLADMTDEGYLTEWVGYDTARWTPVATPPPVDVFVSESATAPNESAPGFWKYNIGDYWHVSTSVGEGGSMIWTYNNDLAHGITNMAHWRPNLPEASLYEVKVYIPSNNATTIDARYEIYHAGGCTDVSLNQLRYSDQWVSLGTYQFNAGTEGFLKLIDMTSEGYGKSRIGFDAARWVKHDPPPAVDTFVSESAIALVDGQPGFYRHGTAKYWRDDWAVGDQGHMFWTNVTGQGNTADNIGDWRPILPHTGWYEVQVYIPHLNATTKEAHYEVTHANGVTPVIINQYLYNDAWVSLGTFQFDAGSSGFLRLTDRTNESNLALKIGFDSARWLEKPAPSAVTKYVSESSETFQRGTPGFWRSGTASYWHDATNTGQDGHMLWTYNNQQLTELDNIGEWWPNLPESRYYKVRAYIPEFYATTVKAKYEIHHADGIDIVVVNQANISNEWVDLGTFRFTSGVGNYVRLADVTGEDDEKFKIGFDAMEWVDAANPPAIGMIVPECVAAASESEPGFWRQGNSDNWQSDSCGEDENMFYTLSVSAVDNVGQWRPVLPAAQWYEVLAHIPSANVSTKKAHYEIHHADGIADVYVDQSVFKDKWMGLGRYRFDSGTDSYVRLTDVTGESGNLCIGFDTMKWEPRDAPSTVTTYVSEWSIAPIAGEPGFWKQGTSSNWKMATGDGDNASFIYTAGIKNVAEDNSGIWRPNLPFTGTYSVYAYIPKINLSTVGAHYVVHHSGGNSDVYIDQTAQAGKWVVLGTFNFNTGKDAYVSLNDVTSDDTYRRISFDAVEWRPLITAHPNAPTPLQPTQSAVTTDSNITFSWQDNGTDQGQPVPQFKVQVWCITDGARGDLLLDSDWTSSTSKTWTAPRIGEYEWVIIASNGMEDTATSIPSRFRVMYLPESPDHLAASPLSSTSVELTWKDNSSTEIGFKLERKSGDGSFTEILTLDSDEFICVDSGLMPGIDYTYRIHSYNDAGYSGYSNEVVISTKDKNPPIIKNVTVTPQTVVKGGTVHVMVETNDDVGVVSVAANGMQLINTQSDIWEGDTDASDDPGNQIVAVVSSDGAGNAVTNLEQKYTVLPVVTCNIRAIYDPITAISANSYAFAVYGKVTVIDDNSFYLSDGSPASYSGQSQPLQLKIEATSHGLSTGDYISARGTLDTIGSPMILHCSSRNITKYN